MTKTRVVIHGAAGRMGRRLIALGSTDPELQIVAALERAGNPELGQDAGPLAGVPVLGVPLAGTLAGAADVLGALPVTEREGEPGRLVRRVFGAGDQLHFLDQPGEGKSLLEARGQVEGLLKEWRERL